jgi:transcriptional regulator with XRE-family HTH domain
MAVPKRVATEPRATTPPRTSPKVPRKTNGAQPQPLVNNNRFAPGLVGARLRERRLERGITLRQFARDIDVSASFISQLETGKAQPSVATFYSICAALDISIDELFNYDEPSGSTSGDSTNGRTDAANNTWLTVEQTSAPAAKEHIRQDGASSPVVRPNERKVLVLDSGVTWESLISSHRDKTDFMFVRYEVGGSSTLEDRLIRHAGTEYGFILKGTLQIALGFDTYVLNAGDSICFDSSRPHRLYNVGDVAVEAIWVNLEFRGN